MGGGPLVLTVAVSSPEEVQALTHAVQTADVLVARSGLQGEGEPPAPEAFTPVVEAPDRLPPDPDEAPSGTAQREQGG